MYYSVNIMIVVFLLVHLMVTTHNYKNQRFRFKLKHHDYNLITSPTGDDTSVNAIQMYCRDNGADVGSIISGEGSNGGWKSPVSCTDVNDIIVRFRVRVDEANQDQFPPLLEDDVGISAVQVKCGPNASGGDSTYDVGSEPDDWGAWGPWSNSCPLQYGVCGLQSRIDPSSGLNNMNLFCCEFP